MAQDEIMIGDRPARTFASAAEAKKYYGDYRASVLDKGKERRARRKGKELFAKFLAAEERRGARMQELRGQTGMRATMAQRRAFFEEPDSSMRRTTGAV